VAVYEPGPRYFCEWFKQLFGESEGKQGKGIFPASAEFTADLHSLGQYLQEGEKQIFETVLNFGNSSYNVCIPYDNKNIDGLNYLSGKNLDFIRDQAFRGAIKAHADGGVPSIIINAPDISALSNGKLVIFFEFSCAFGLYAWRKSI
jgi:glucose-6-phosphate isomerase